MRQSNKVNTIHTRISLYSARLHIVPWNVIDRSKSKYVSHKNNALPRSTDGWITQTPWFRVCVCVFASFISAHKLIACAYKSHATVDLILAIRLCQSIECFISLVRLARDSSSYRISIYLYTGAVFLVDRIERICFHLIGQSDVLRN